jgi:glycosyltransferase involved in cell wall biosynthesis
MFKEEKMYIAVNFVIQDGVNGILIPTKNTDAIVRVIKNMIYNEEFRLSMAKESRKNMVENFEQTDFWDKILAFYESKLKNK